MEARMTWTLLLLLTAGWLLVLLAGTGPPWSWALPAAIAALLVYRVIGVLQRE